MAQKKQGVAVAGDEERVGMSLRLSPELYDRLRKMNYETRESMHSIMLRGLELALKEAKY